MDSTNNWNQNYFSAKKVNETGQSTNFSFALLIIPLAVLCCLFLLCVRVIHVLIKNQGSSKTDETNQDDGSGLDDAETFSMTVFNSVTEEEDGHNQKDRSRFQDIIELKEEEEDEEQEVFSSKDVQNTALDESIILRKSLRKGEGGMPVAPRTLGTSCARSPETHPHPAAACPGSCRALRGPDSAPSPSWCRHSSMCVGQWS